MKEDSRRPEVVESDKMFSYGFSSPLLSFPFCSVIFLPEKFSLKSDLSCLIKLISQRFFPLTKSTE